MKEIIKGIIAEMREFIKNPTIGTKTSCEVKLENYLKGCMKDYADRIEVVVTKMETTTPTCKESLQVGNAAKMREALETISKCDICKEEDCYTLYRVCEAALSAPPRNCDVGTLEEQSKRFGKFCTPQKCRECTLYIDGAFGDCGVRWSQLPYEKGGEE